MPAASSKAAEAPWTDWPVRMDSRALRAYKLRVLGHGGLPCLGHSLRSQRHALAQSSPGGLFPSNPARLVCPGDRRRLRGLFDPSAGAGSVLLVLSWSCSHSGICEGPRYEPPGVAGDPGSGFRKFPLPKVLRNFRRQPDPQPSPFGSFQCWPRWVRLDRLCLVVDTS